MISGGSQFLLSCIAYFRRPYLRLEEGRVSVCFYIEEGRVVIGYRVLGWLVPISNLLALVVYVSYDIGREFYYLVRFIVVESAYDIDGPPFEMDFEYVFMYSNVVMINPLYF